MGSRRSKGCQRTVRGHLRRHLGWLILLCSIGGPVFTARAAEAPDDGLLEFLGSVDTEDKDWHDYLVRTDIDKIARRAGNASNPDGTAVAARPKPPDPPQLPPATFPAGNAPPTGSSAPPSTAAPVPGKPVASP